MIHLSFAICALLAVSCSNSKEADSRQDQEKMFRELFGFEPPKAVSEIKYKDVYNRHLMNGGWGRWMSFTYTEEVFSKILKELGYKQREELHFVDLKSDAAPIWWPNFDQSKITLYLRGHKTRKSPRDIHFKIIFGTIRIRISCISIKNIGINHPHAKCSHGLHGGPCDAAEIPAVNL